MSCRPTATSARPRLCRATDHDINNREDEGNARVHASLRTNDTSYKKLGELLIANPMDILIERDERLRRWMLIARTASIESRP
jgi:hypothetical protein